MNYAAFLGVISAIGLMDIAMASRGDFTIFFKLSPRLIVLGDAFGPARPGINKKLTDDFLTPGEIKNIKVRDRGRGVSIILPGVAAVPGENRLPGRALGLPEPGWWTMTADKTGIPGNSKPDDHESCYREILHQFKDFAEIPIRVNVVLGKKRAPLKELLNLEPGSLLELERSVEEGVSVYLEDTFFAGGEVTVLDDTFAVKITGIG